MEVAAFLKTDAKASEYPRLDPSWTFGFPVGSCTGTLIVSDTGSCELQLHDASTSALVAQWQVSCSRIYVSEDGRHGKVLQIRSVSRPSPTAPNEYGWLVIDGSASFREMKSSQLRPTGVTFHSTPQSSNQAMQLTASKLAIYAVGVCHRASGLRASRSGLAAADLVSR